MQRSPNNRKLSPRRQLMKEKLFSGEMMVSARGRERDTHVSRSLVVSCASGRSKQNQFTSTQTNGQVVNEPFMDSFALDSCRSSQRPNTSRKWTNVGVNPNSVNITELLDKAAYGSGSKKIDPISPEKPTSSQVR